MNNKKIDIKKTLLQTIRFVSTKTPDLSAVS